MLQMNVTNTSFLIFASLLLLIQAFLEHCADEDGAHPFKTFCDYCSDNNKVADVLLDYNQVDLAAYAEMLLLTAPIVTSESRHMFKENCMRENLSNLLNVTEEAFALLLWENCFEKWKWIAKKQLNDQQSLILTLVPLCCLPHHRCPP